MQDIECVGRDEVTRIFRYKYEKDQFNDTWHFQVFARPAPPSGEFFELSVSAIDGATVRVTTIAHHGEPVYMAKGIPDALLPVVKATLGKDVVSSPQKGQDGVWRTADATKVWERLRSRDQATYDGSTDVYKLA